MRKLGNDRLFLIIISIYICGIVSSFLIVTPEIVTISEKNVNIWGIIQTFTLNYWYILLMWIFGLSIAGVIFNIFIVFFRGFLYGNLIVFIIKINTSYLLVISLIEIIIFVPMFIILAYRSIMLSLNKHRLGRLELENYNKLLIFMTITIFIYSILLEIVGGMYG